MLELTYDPPAASFATPGTFLQTIRLVDGREPIGQARWFCGADLGQGVAQILELSIVATKRRQEHGRRLMEGVTAQAKQYFKANKSKLRRLWISLEQERQVIGRSFLMKFGFHHVGTVHELLKGEDMLVYMRTFD